VGEFEPQNIPIPIDPDKSLRKAFLGRRRRLTADIDYSRIELRVLKQAENFAPRDMGRFYGGGRR